jgi:crotonobetainyl-CoA:carnitine CoA-transferase CaiB-like acyl-CoA transferase
MPAPYAGIQVLEITAGISGSYCGKLFADAGADVVKVEPPGGDPLRHWSATGADIAPGETGALFDFLSGGKKSVRSGSDAASAPAGLLEQADLVIVDGCAGWDAASINRLAADQPWSVVVSISPFGLTGPYVESGLATNEFVLQAMCGSLARRGWPEGRPLQAGGRIGEWAAGIYGALGGAAALRRARMSGFGEFVDVSVYESMVVTMGGLDAVTYSIFGADAPFQGRAVEVPSIVETADGLVGFCTVTGQQFRDFMIMLGRPELLDDADLATFAGRLRRHEEFLAIVGEWTEQRTTAEIIELASMMRIPVAPIGSPDTVTDIDHFRDRGVFVKNPTGHLQPRVPYRSDLLATAGPAAAPRLGADTEAVGWTPRKNSANVATSADATSPGDRARPLAGVRVLDFTAFWAGPAATQLLGALGAEVIKIEGLSRPDGIRFSGGFPPDDQNWWEWGPLFLACNVDKRDVTLELNDPRAREIALRLAAKCDLVIENFSPRVMTNLGLEWDSFHAVNPNLVMVRMPAFGLDGPWRDRGGFAQTIEQASGIAWLTGEADGLPMIPRGPCDPIAGLHAAFAALVGLEVQSQTGTGLQIESTMIEAALNVAAEAMLEYNAYGRALARDGNRGPGAAPQGAYRCQGDDVWIAISVLSDDHWRSLYQLLGEPAPPVGVDLAAAAGRASSGDLLDDWIAGWTAGRTAPELLADLHAAAIPAALVNRGKDLLGDRQLAHRHFWQPVTHPVVGSIEIAGLPFRYASQPDEWSHRAAPVLGEHNREVLGGLLGMSKAELDVLESESVIGTRPLGV